MKATEILMTEHRVIERVVNTLETAANYLQQGGDVRPGFFVEAADFIKNFADGSHHKKEEGVLFPAFAEKGIPVDGGPVGVMLSEHEQGRAYTLAMHAAALKLTDEPSARKTVIENALGYAALLKQHIMKEERILFPLADRVIPLEKQKRVQEDFEHIDNNEISSGVQAKYLALASALEQESSQFMKEA